MYPPDPFESPRSSFQEPVIAPVNEPNAGALTSVCFAQSWLPYILGALQQLTQDTNWLTTNESELATAQARAQLLCDMFMNGWCEMTTGLVAFFAGSTPPDGWLICNGAAVDRACYAALFATIGTVFGAGDGSTTFNLPDLGGRVPLGVGQQSGGTNFALGNTGGAETVTLTTAQMPSHTHTDSGHAHSYGATLPLVALTGEEPVAVQNPLPGTTGTGNANLNNTGGDEAHPNLQPYLALLAIIKT